MNVLREFRDMDVLLRHALGRAQALYRETRDENARRVTVALDGALRDLGEAELRELGRRLPAGWSL